MPVVMIYVQHLLGIGHLMRARLIAEALADAGSDVHLVSGGMPIGGRMPRGVRIVQLPPIRVSDASFMPLRDGDYVPIDEGYRTTRRDMLLATFDALDRFAYEHKRPLTLPLVREWLQRRLGS